MSVKISVGLNQLALKQNYQLTVGAIEAVAQHISALADGEEKARYIGQLALQSKRVKDFPIAGLRPTCYSPSVGREGQGALCAG